MHNYSDNWRHLKSILDGYARNQSPKLYSYKDHIHAKALSIFLAHASLATPKLDRKTVESVLAGSLSWPHNLDSGQFLGVNLPLSLLEENGLIAFYADWCTVHCRSLRNPDNVDQSLSQLIQAIEHLKDICYGRNGYIQPHFTCSANELEGLLETPFGSASVAELLPDLRLEDGLFKLPPGNQNFSSLVSTNLWFKLRETLEPKEAFEWWILCLRVNCKWAMPVLFDDFDYEQRSEFNEQLLAYLAQEPALGCNMVILRKQSINRDNFASILTPFESRLHMTIDAEGNCRSEHQDIPLEKPTLETLSTAYPLSCNDDSSDVQFVRQWQQLGHWREPELFYTWLLASAIESSILIDGQALISRDFIEDLLELTTSRPILKYLLFNSVPEHESATYMIWLLSRPATCDIALFYLTQRSFASSRRESHSFTLHFDKGYQQLVCHEYLRTIEQEPDSGDRLLKVIEFLGERCGLHSGNFSKSFEYQFLLCLLDSLSHQRIIQLGQAFAQHPTVTEKTPAHQPPQHFWYLLGFWLLERLENTGIDPTGTISRSLRTTLLRDYKAEFEANLAGLRRSLEPNYFFSALPWYKLVEHEGIAPLLALSNNCCGWQQSLGYENKNNFTVASAVRHYLQVLTCIGQPQKIPKDWERVANRAAEIVRILGFGPREQTIHLFDGAFYADKYDLWTPFCSYANLFRDYLYDDFIERCMSLIPLNQLFVLLERCTVIARTMKLQEEIAIRQSPETEDLELSALEQAFISAWESGHTVLAIKLLDSAKAFLAEERFATTNNPHIVRARKVWLSYEYKWQLLKRLETLKHDPQKFAEVARQLPIPHELKGGRTYQEDDRTHWRECERFRRYIIATAHCETNPKRCVGIMEALYKETKNSVHSFMLFKGRMALHENNHDAIGLRHALSQFLSSLGDTEPELMPSYWVATILDAYRLLQDYPEISEFWIKLNSDQQARLEILRPYCLALIAHGDALIAQQIFNRYRELNKETPEGLGDNDLLDELFKALPTPPISQTIQLINEGSQRTIVQLVKHYSQIVSKEFEDYVAIVSQGQPPHEFLKNAVLEVAEELLLRKKNLQLHHRNSNDEESFRITKEDLINDWFTSLFDKRMAEARIGIRDQKRGGQSASGEGPGEIDGYITHAKNKRIAIFEAFRLFSKDTTVISDHLNKIAGYDNESLSPVFIAAYCDVSDFAALAQGYAEFIVRTNYTGFTVDAETGSSVKALHNTDHLWLGMEKRRRNHQEIIFYHLLLNMRFQEKSTS